MWVLSILYDPNSKSHAILAFIMMFTYYEKQILVVYGRITAEKIARGHNEHLQDASFIGG